MIYIKLLLGFLKVGCFSFGGAYGAIPLIRDVVLENGWMSEDRLAYMIAVSESTPGPIMVNVATFVGNTKGGFFGAVVATLAVVLPSFIIILLIASVFTTILKNVYVKSTITGLKPCIIGLIAATGLYMIISACFSGLSDFSFNLKTAVLTLILGAALIVPKYVFKKKTSPIFLILFSAVLGIILYSF